MLESGQVRVTRPVIEGVPTERLRALMRLLYPAEMTPVAKRLFEQVIEECELSK